MKKKLCLLFSVLALSTFGFAACGGEEKPSVKRYNVTISQDGADDIILWIEHGKTIDLSQLPQLPQANTGYEYVWSRDITAPVTENLAIEALLKAKTYTITFDLKGQGSMSETTMQVTYDAAYKLPRPADGRLSEFLYWKGENGAQFPTQGTWNIDNDITLTAAWAFWTPNV